MAYSKNLAEIRHALAHLPEVEEKKMFGSLAFMVNGKLCLTAGPDRMMCRIDPKLHDQEIQRKGCQTVVMKGRDYKGYIYISEKTLQQESDFQHWIDLALAFNKKLTAQ